MRLGDGEVTHEPQALREDRQANAATDWLDQRAYCTPEERQQITDYLLNQAELRAARRWSEAFTDFIERKIHDSNS